MNIAPKFITCEEKKLVGKKISTSLSENRTAELWRSFMPLRSRLGQRSKKELYSVEIYDPGYFNLFSPAALFEKWAAVEMQQPDDMPEGLETLIIPQGLYAVFHSRGNYAQGRALLQYIFMSWLPASEYMPDERPHLAVMGDKYKGDTEDSEEDFWIPVKRK